MNTATAKYANRLAEEIKERWGYEMIVETYINSNTKATFVCPTHGEFQAFPNNVKRGRQSCKKCYPKQNYEAYYERTFLKVQRQSPYAIVQSTYQGTGQKATFVCPKHGEFQARVQDVIGAQSQRCPVCVKEAKKSPTKARNAAQYPFLDKIHPKDRKRLLEGILGTEDKVRFRCDVCGEYYAMTPTVYKQGNRHLTCSAKERGRKQRKTDYDFLHEVREDYREKIQSGEILSAKKVPFICKEHGEYWQSLAAHQRGDGCPGCGELKSRHGQRAIYDFADLRPDYKKKVKAKEILSHEKVPFICEIHGEYWQSLTQHKKGIGCPECGAKKASMARRKQSYAIYDQLRDDYKEMVDTSDITSNDYAVFVCKKHGEYTRQIGDAEFRSVDGKTACPVCNLAMTPHSFHEFLRTIVKNITVNDRQQIAPKEIDFYLPDHKIGFEFNDIRTHQTLFREQEANRNNRGGKPSTYHYNKYLGCKERGIRLFHIWDIEWADERVRPILESVIKNALGLNERKVYARSCELVASDSKECNPFFLENHIQGGAKGNGYFALKNKGEIVGAICYTDKIKLVKAHNENDADITISRMCFKQGVSVVGGASRLLKAVTDLMTSGQKIEYLVLNDYFDGVSFEKTGWETVKWYPMVRYYDRAKNHAYYRAPSRYVDRKEKCLAGKMYRYYTSGTTVYRKSV